VRPWSALLPEWLNQKRGEGGPRGGNYSKKKTRNGLGKNAPGVSNRQAQGWEPDGYRKKEPQTSPDEEGGESGLWAEVGRREEKQMCFTTTPLVPLVDDNGGNRKVEGAT